MWAGNEICTVPILICDNRVDIERAIVAAVKNDVDSKKKFYEKKLGVVIGEILIKRIPN